LTPASIHMTADRYGHLFPRGDDGAEPPPSARFCEAEATRAISSKTDDRAAAIMEAALAGTE
jgi:hypothetical protein